MTCNVIYLNAVKTDAPVETNSHVPCRAVLRPCRFSTSQGHGRGTALYVCELTSAVFRWPVGDLPRFGFFRIPRGVSRLAVRGFPVTRGLSRRTRHCRRKAGTRHGMCELVRHGTAGTRHGICELSLNCTRNFSPYLTENSRQPVRNATVCFARNRPYLNWRQLIPVALKSLQLVFQTKLFSTNQKSKFRHRYFKPILSPF